jgi:hypothetical protein
MIDAEKTARGDWKKVERAIVLGSLRARVRNKAYYIIEEAESLYAWRCDGMPMICPRWQRCSTAGEGPTEIR